MKGVIVVDIPDELGEKMKEPNFILKTDLLGKTYRINPLPEKDHSSHFPDEFGDGFAAGWNACIDKVTRGGSNG